MVDCEEAYMPSSPWQIQYQSWVDIGWRLTIAGAPESSLIHSHNATLAEEAATISCCALQRFGIQHVHEWPFTAFYNHSDLSVNQQLQQGQGRSVDQRQLIFITGPDRYSQHL